MKIFKMFLALTLFGLCGVAFGATDQNSSASYQIEIKRSVKLSTTPLLSSDTILIESDCIGGRQTLTGACRKGSLSGDGRAGLIYKVTYTNAGTTTVDVSVLFFSESFTSPGDNEPWALTDGAFRKSYLGRVDLPQAVEQEGGGDVYAEAVDVNIPYFCTVDGSIYAQVVKNLVGPIFLGGDTRSASADGQLTVFVHQF